MQRPRSTRTRGARTDEIPPCTKLSNALLFKSSALVFHQGALSAAMAQAARMQPGKASSRRFMRHHPTSRRNQLSSEDFCTRSQATGVAFNEGRMHVYAFRVLIFFIYLLFLVIYIFTWIRKMQRCFLASKFLGTFLVCQPLRLGSCNLH
jgi:hypothetical protein